MIVLHRLGHGAEPFHLNADLLQTVEARPDTVVTLVTGAHIVVDETPEEVVEAVRAWHASVLGAAFANPPSLSLVRPEGAGRGADY